MVKAPILLSVTGGWRFLSLAHSRLGMKGKFITGNGYYARGLISISLQFNA
jgi:hypothetical protein